MRRLAIWLISIATTHAFAGPQTYFSCEKEQWRQLPGCAQDIGVGFDGSAFIIGCNKTGNDYGIWKLINGQWTEIGGLATRIAVTPEGIPWVVNSGGNIWRWSEVAGWQLMPGLAYDIGIGTHGHVWVVGRDAENGGFGVHRWNGTTWEKIDGGAVRISVAPIGLPWVLNNAFQIWRRVENKWELIPGQARDIGVGPTGDVYVIGVTALNGGYDIQRWSGTRFERIPGAAMNLSVGATGEPWVVNSAGHIFQGCTP